MENQIVCVELDSDKDIPKDKESKAKNREQKLLS